MEISIIIITFQRGQLLQTCLDSTYSQTKLEKPFEIIVVDNDGSATVTPPSDPQIELRVIRSTSNLGVAGGRNLGISESRGKYLIFIDDDATWCSPDSVYRVVEHLRGNPRCGAVAVKSLRPDGVSIVGEYPHPDKKFIAEVDQPIEVPYYYGVGHGLKREALLIPEAYPVRYFYSMEEIDLSLRIIDGGYVIIYDPNIGVFHSHSSFGRPVVGVSYWKRNMLNKCRVAWRLLPYHYLATIFFIWSIAVIVKTKRLFPMFAVWRDLWQERHQLAQERKPIKSSSIAYLRSIGARLLY